jgi:hypothetical protein
MIGENNMGVIADQKIITNGDARGSKLLDFFKKPWRIDDHSVADYRAKMRLENSGWEQGEFESFAVLYDSVTGISAAIESNNEIVLRSQEIDNFAFSLVAPLQADDTGTGHCLPTPEDWRPRKSWASPVWGLVQKNARDPKGLGLLTANRQIYRRP